jgi:hypothetical protein
MRRLSVALVVLALLLPAYAAPPAGAAGPVTLGRVAASGDEASQCTTPRTIVQRTPVSLSTAPNPGVITSFSTFATGSGSIRALVFTPTPTGYHLVAASPVVSATEVSKVVTFGARLRFPQGAVLGLWSAAGHYCLVYNTASSVVGSSTFDPDSQTELTGESGPAVLNLSAVLEPDADGDGWGDLTQDPCPSAGSAAGPCATPAGPVGPVALDTVLVKGPARHLTKRRVRLVFASPAPGATFTCKVDRARAKPCASPYTRRYSYGRHRVVITAVSADGTVADATPLTVRFSVHQRRRR